MHAREEIRHALVGVCLLAMRWAAAVTAFGFILFVIIDTLPR